MNLAKVLYENDASKDEVAFFFEGKSMSYGQLRAKTDALALALQRAGLAPGDHVAIVFPNCFEFVISYFAVIKAGGVVIPVNPVLRPYEMSYILDHSDAKIIIYYKPVENTVRESIKAIDRELKLFSSEDILKWAEKSTDPILVDRDPEDVAVIMYTSGTTGKPKGAMLSHKNLLSNADSVIDGLGLVEEDVMLTVLPLFHSFGAMVGMIAPMLAGAKVVLVPRFTPQKIIESVKKYKATIFPAVPSMFALLNQVKDATAKDLFSLKFCISGGAPLPLEVMNEFERKYGVLIYEGDGPTECSPVTSVNPIGGKRKPGSIGLPVKNVEMKIADEKGNFLPPGQLGEIVVKGPNVMKGYYKDERATREAFFGEYLRTGDIGKMDEEGYFYILDRKKDMIIVNGMNVYPREIEEILYRHPAVAEAAVVAAPHPLHGEVPVAFIVLREGKVVSEQDIITYLESYITNFKLPKKVFFREELPKTATGKISKVALRGEVRNLFS